MHAGQPELEVDRLQDLETGPFLLQLAYSLSQLTSCYANCSRHYARVLDEQSARLVILDETVRSR